MSEVSAAVVMGAQKVVTDLALERRYQNAAMKALMMEMEGVKMQFEAFAVKKGGKEDATDIGFWKPEPWATAVCCMKGMDCFSGAFETKAARENLVKELAGFEEELVGVKKLYDELNQDNLDKAAEQRAQDLAAARVAANKIVNSIADAEKKE